MHAQPGYRPEFLRMFTQCGRQAHVVQHAWAQIFNDAAFQIDGFLDRPDGTLQPVRELWIRSRQLVGDNGDVHGDDGQVGAQFVMQFAREFGLFFFGDIDQMTRQDR